MNHFRQILFATLLPIALHAQDVDSASAVEDSSEDTPLVEVAPPPTPLVRTWISMDPLTAALGLAPNLQVERHLGGSISVVGSGYWGIGVVNRGWGLALRHHFQPALAGGFIGVFVSGMENETPFDLPENSSTRSFTLRQEGVVAGFQGGSLKVYPSGFSIGWNAGLGWPWIYQEWLGATPTENAQMVRNLSLAGAMIDAGLWMGFAF